MTPDAVIEPTPARRRTWGLVREFLRDPGGKAVAGLIALAIGFIAWQVFKWGGPSHKTLISDLSFLPVSITAAVVAWRTSRSRELDDRTRRAWLICGLAFFCYWVGDFVFTLEENLGHPAPFPSWADAAYLVFYVVLLWGVLAFPTAPQTRNDRTKLWLDTGIVVLGAFMVLWYFAIGPTVRSTGSTSLAAAVSIAYPIGDLVLVLAITRILLAEPQAGLGRAMGILAAGLLLFVIADVAFANMSLTDTYAGGDWTDSLWMVAQVLMAASAQYHFWHATRETTHQDLAESRRLRTFSPWPYLVVFGSFTLLVIVGWHVSAYPLGGLMLGAIGVTTLVVLRQIAALRENMTLLTELHQLASTDMLTGLQSRRHFFETAEREFYLARRYERELCAMMIDIDHFKSINDTYGHAAGDRALQELSALCRDRLRATDLVGRYGGDELVVLLPQTDVEHALEIAQRIRCGVDELSIETDNETFGFTISIGVATAYSAADLAQLLRRADRALYQAKQEGRNTTATLSA